MVKGRECMCDKWSHDEINDIIILNHSVFCRLDIKLKFLYNQLPLFSPLPIGFLNLSRACPLGSGSVIIFSQKCLLCHFVSSMISAFISHGRKNTCEQLYGTKLLDTGVSMTCPYCCMQKTYTRIILNMYQYVHMNYKIPTKVVFVETPSFLVFCWLNKAPNDLLIFVGNRNCDKWKY